MASELREWEMSAHEDIGEEAWNIVEGKGYEYDVLTGLILASEKVLQKTERAINRVPGLSHEDLELLRTALYKARSVVDG